MKKILEKIKQYKWAFLGLTLLIFVGVVWLFFPRETSETTSLAPITVKEEEKNPTMLSKNDFFIEEVFPPSGKTQLWTKYTYIMFTFSKPIIEKDVTVSVKPYISLKNTFSDDGKTLYVSPRAEPWLDGVRYTITITNIRSTTGDKLDSETISHEYYNEEPTVINGI